MVRLKRCPSLAILSTLFGISTALASRISITWILFMEKEIAFLLEFTTLEEIEGLKRQKYLEMSSMKNSEQSLTVLSFI